MPPSLRTLLLLLALAAGLGAQRLPLRAYAPADGLPGGWIHRILEDRGGFLWFCSGEGAARFDGYRFDRPLAGAGGPAEEVLDLMQSRDGRLWLATPLGVVRVDPAVDPARPAGERRVRFQAAAGPVYANCMLEDGSGAVWVGTATGLFRLAPGASELEPVDLGTPTRTPDDRIVTALAPRPGGGIWVGALSGLYALDPGRAARRYAIPEGLPAEDLRALALDPSGTLWAATRAGIAEIQGAGPVRVIRHGLKEGLANEDVHALRIDREGRLVAGTTGGLSILHRGRVENHGPEQGVKVPVVSLAETAGGDLWLGNDGGVQRWTRNGLVTFLPADGSNPRVDDLLVDRTGTLVAVRNGPGAAWLQRLEGGRLAGGRVALPQGVRAPGWGWHQTLLQDRTGDWWYATAAGLARYGGAPTAAALTGSARGRVYDVRGIVPNSTSVFAVYEDRAGDVWFSIDSPGGNGLGCWRRATDRIESFNGRAGFAERPALATAFTEDRHGSLWMGFNDGAVARYRNGRFERFGPEAGAPAGWVRCLLADGAGRLWVGASRGGAAFTADPAAAAPRFQAFTRAEGLSGKGVWSLAEDRLGRIYAGTAAGVDRLDPAGGRPFHLTGAHGLAGGLPRAALRDAEGTLWFGTSEGLSSYRPPATIAQGPPRAFLTGVRVAGSVRGLPETGTVDWALGALEPWQNRIQVDFTSPGGLGDAALQYQYRMEGIAQDWTAPGLDRTVDLASLAPGAYHFQVRALRAGGRPGPEAELRFTVRPPVWRRPWFLVLAAAVLGGLTWLAYRYRLNRLLEVERIRTRIAADLHDDIGAGLSRIVILSEVVKRGAGLDPEASRRFLDEIADGSRELVDSMSDIVWSVDPRRDDLQQLLGRAGHFAAGLLEPRGIRWTLEAPPDPASVKLPPALRRGLFLALKEALNNAARHSGCATVQVRVTVTERRLVAEVRDDGRGLEAVDPEASRQGNGLANLHRRARELGGRLDLEGGPGGTTVRLDLPRSP